jgi:hypothetical protein
MDTHHASRVRQAPPYFIGHTSVFSELDVCSDHRHASNLFGSDKNRRIMSAERAHRTLSANFGLDLQILTFMII